MNVHFEKWIAGYIKPRLPELEKPLRAARDAYDSIESEHQCNQEMLAPVVEAASSLRVPLSETGTTLLRRLAATMHEARDAVGQMFASRSSHVRLSAILCTSKEAPREFTLGLLKSGLRDRSSRVRIKAADRVLSLRCTELITELEHRVVTESSIRARAGLLFSLKLLRDGSIVEQHGDDGVSVTVITEHGVRARVVPRSRVQIEGLPSIIAELRYTSGEPGATDNPVRAP